MFNPRRKRRIGVEDTMALGGGLMPKPIHFKENPQGQPLANIKSLDKFSLTNEIGNKENEKKSTLQIIRPPRCRILHQSCDPHAHRKEFGSSSRNPQKFE
jgi:hypothetical protein